MANQTHQISAVVPAYNEAGRIGNTIKSISSFVDEIVVIDDGSQDSTAEEAKRHRARVFIQANQGYIAAIKHGFQRVEGDIVVTIDADGELPAEKIPELIQPILEDKADMVQGNRNIVPRPSERFLNWLANLKTDVGDSGTGFRALRTELARELMIRGACICGILSLEVNAKGGRIMEIPIQLKSVDKPRRIAWYHFRQFFYLLPWMFR
jgi:glycosyltransferase involved in cell wall biosynthesis